MGKILVILAVVVVFLLGGVTGYLVGSKQKEPGATSNTKAGDMLPGSEQFRPGKSPISNPRPREQVLGKPDLVEFADKLPAIERIMDRFYRGDPVEKANASVSRLVDDHNQWVQARNAEHQARREKLKERLADVRRFEARIGDMDKHLTRAKPDPTDKSAVEAYNALVSLRNSLIEQYEELGKLCEDDAKAFKQALARSKQEAAARWNRVEAAKQRAMEEVKAYQQWVDSDRSLPFSMDINGFYARLHQQRRRIGRSPELDASIDKARAIRLELGAWALKQQAGGKGRLIVVPAKLCRREDCFLIVDTGATCVVISPALVEALGLSDQVGDEVKVSLVGGVRIMAKELVIPQLSVFGMEASDVEAVVVNEPKLGVDGLLGLSFLNRFNYRIDKKRDPKLTLEPKPE